MAQPSSYAPIRIKALKPLHDHIVVKDMQFKERLTSAGIVILGDDQTTSGIRPRWAEVYAVGPDQKEIKPGQWIMVEHGRWTRGVRIEDDSGVFDIRRVDNNAIIFVSDEPQIDDTMSSAVLVNKESR